MKCFFLQQEIDIFALENENMPVRDVFHNAVSKRMDKVKEYKTIVRKLVEEIGQMGSSSFEDIETQIITDDEHGHYLLYSNGWSNESRTYGCYVHIDVRPDGKVWLQHDGTNLVLANELQAKGILKTDIVLGFHSPFLRTHAEYAAA